ncbi:MAG TPA: hypothetical protein VFG67_11535, partial [Oleiagrimonas sp.]|nr:hypothetical protein [Oleiagrimonas sp.]
HDHWLTRSEIPHKMHYLRQHFGEADVTHDRKLSRGEYASFSAPLLDKNNASILNSKLRNSRSNISLPPQPTAMKH